MLSILQLNEQKNKKRKKFVEQISYRLHSKTNKKAKIKIKKVKNYFKNFKFLILFKNKKKKLFD